MVQKAWIFIKRVLMFIGGAKSENTEVSSSPASLPPPSPVVPTQAVPETIVPAPAPAVPEPPVVAEPAPIVPQRAEVANPSPATIQFDEFTEQHLQQLFPPFAKDVRGFLIEAHARGMKVGIFSGLRTWEEQERLYRKGRNVDGKVINKSQVVTNAPPGSSYHNYGLAVDLVFDRDEVRPGWQWSWDNKHPWKALATLGKERGLESAYFWTSFPEAPHFQSTFGFPTSELKLTFRAGGLERVWSKIDKRISGATV